jgi:hypothetical protein
MAAAAALAAVASLGMAHAQERASHSDQAKATRASRLPGKRLGLEKPDRTEPPRDPRPCPGSNGSPPTLRISFADVPAYAMTLDVHGRAHAPVLLLFGSSTETYRALALPFDLSGLGAPGCQLRVSIDFALPLRTDATGLARARLTEPPAEVRLFAQGLVFDPGSNAAGLTLTNALELGGH